MLLQFKNRLNTLRATQSELLDLKAYKAFTYTKAAVDAKIDNLVNEAPLRLNTLKELAQALGDDEDLSSTVLNSIAKVSRIQVSDYPRASGSDWFWQPGRRSIPNDRHHATITVNACNGWNLNFRGGGSGVNFITDLI